MPEDKGGFDQWLHDHFTTIFMVLFAAWIVFVMCMYSFGGYLLYRFAQWFFAKH